MRDPESVYFHWLYNQLGVSTVLPPTYVTLATQLHHKSFRWFVPFDENHAAQGAELRDEFMREMQLPSYRGVCTVLEMLIALSRRCERTSFVWRGDDGPAFWFWHMMHNIGLDRFTDEYYAGNPNADDEVDEILEVLLRRTYDRKGNGGLFPLREPPNDQRKTTLWYQLNYYMIENPEI